MKKTKRILIFPNTNTLSHLSRALTIAEWLNLCDFETHIGLSNLRLSWASKFHSNCHEISELWQFSGMPYPCTQWFSNKKNIELCLSSQEKLINELKPDIIIGIFDFFSSISSKDIPFISINGACMLPLFNEVLGFDGNKIPERDEQKKIFDNFWAFAASSFNPSLEKRKLPIKKFANELLIGDHNLIYEISEICKINNSYENCHLIGPIMWDGWETASEELLWEKTDKKNTIYINSGTLPLREKTIKFIIRKSLSTNSRVLISSGMNGIVETSENLLCRPFFPPTKATNICDVVIFSGGIGVCYINLFNGVPSLVLPTQPEQVTNGINLQNAGCGRVLMNNILFAGDFRKYEKAFDQDKFEDALNDILDNKIKYSRVKDIKKIIIKYNTKDFLTNYVKGLI